MNIFVVFGLNILSSCLPQRYGFGTIRNGPIYDFSTPIPSLTLLWRRSSDEWVLTEAAGVRMLDLGLLKKGKIYSKVLSFCSFLSFTYMPFSLC
jgi:hypothetical protein